MYKKSFIIFLLITALLLCSCSDVYAETVITDIGEYDTIWSLPERRVSEGSLLFPESTDGLEIISFECRHTTYQLVGTGWQVELHVQLDGKSFGLEVERLKELCKNSEVFGENDYFTAPAYAAVWNFNGCYEYAVINEGDNSISYIYLQLTDKDDLTINESFIPEGYEMEQDGESFSVYE